ncbi:MAG TPA: SET domain-containing protein-lysine N-methyltransferase, partial [Burkholderiaceae bacterium]|nr:SET domain-containing protein-lysine N-methyltransferase [Burkholderiaceae bacterium]
MTTSRSRAPASHQPAPPRQTPINQPAAGRRIQVRRSGVHGRGVYAIRPIAKGEVVIEYKGQMITWRQAEKRHPHDPKDPD